MSLVSLYFLAGGLLQLLIFVRISTGVTLRALNAGHRANWPSFFQKRVTQNHLPKCDTKEEGLYHQKAHFYGIKMEYTHKDTLKTRFNSNFRCVCVSKGRWNAHSSTCRVWLSWNVIRLHFYIFKYKNLIFHHHPRHQIPNKRKEKNP